MSVDTCTFRRGYASGSRRPAGNEVGERHADVKQQRTGHQQRNNQFAFMPVQRGRHKCPDLIQNDRRRCNQRYPEGQLDGVKNGEATSVAIIVAPSGICLISGAETT